MNKCRRIKCEYRRQTPKDPCFFHWRSLFRLIPFPSRSGYCIPRPLRTIVFCLFACRLHYPLWKELNAKQFVMKRNKLLRVKKFMIKRQMLGDFKTRWVLNPLDAHKRKFEWRR
jgi:hypothetical protein